MSKGTVSVKGIVDDNDPLTCLQLQFRLQADSSWMNWECFNSDADTEVPNHVLYDNVRSAFCVEDVCGEPSFGKGEFWSVNCSIKSISLIVNVLMLHHQFCLDN